MVCNNDTGVVSWEEAEGVSSYVVQAFGPNSHETLCNSTATSCKLPSLHCGQLYNLTVTAQDGQCDSSLAHHNLQSGLLCISGIIMLEKCDANVEKSISNQDTVETAVL